MAWLLERVAGWMAAVRGEGGRGRVGRQAARRFRGMRSQAHWTLQALEPRQLLTTILGGNVFKPVAYAEIPQFQVEGTTLIEDQVLVHGTDTSTGNGVVQSLTATDGFFSNPQSMTFLSEWKKDHPDDPSSAVVKGAFKNQSGNIVYVLQTATTADANLFQAALDDGTSTQVIDLNPDGQTYVVGISEKGDLVLDTVNAGFLFTNN
ncbi:MAG: hypothetical protein KDA91_24790 [Planctomycetaceae bacterium]|nr:hypothetical protein [Planctomycetaceae bacterium]